MFRLALASLPDTERTLWWQVGVRDPSDVRTLRARHVNPQRYVEYRSLGLGHVDVIRHTHAKVTVDAARWLIDAGMTDPAEQRRYVRRALTSGQIAMLAASGIDDLDDVAWLVDSGVLEAHRWERFLDLGVDDVWVAARFCRDGVLPGLLEACVNEGIELERIREVLDAGVSALDYLWFRRAGISRMVEITRMTRRGISGAEAFQYVTAGIRRAKWMSRIREAGVSGAVAAAYADQGVVGYDAILTAWRDDQRHHGTVNASQPPVAASP